jgi:integrase
MGSLYKRGNTWWIKYYRNGKPLRESSGSKKESDAKRLLRLREGDVARGIPVAPRIGRIKFDELAHDTMTNYRINKRRSLDAIERRFRKHVIPFFGGRRAASITTSDVERFIQSRQEAGASNAEINRELAALKRGFCLGIQAGKLISKPHIPTLQEDNVRTGFFERQQFDTIWKHLPKELQPVATFAYITGWRKSEILSLQWRQVDFKGGTVNLDPGTTKNGEGKTFPLTVKLRQILKVQRYEIDLLRREQATVCPWVFHRGGKPIRSFRVSWATACRKAGLPGRIFHDFRRTAVRNLVRAGVPERVAMQMTGHKTRSVFERYNIVSDGDLVDAAKKIDYTSQTQ